MRQETYINPMTAVTLMMEKVYSASPYTFTSHKLITTIIARKIVIAAQFGMFKFQYSKVIAADIISNGIVKAHCKA